MSDELTPITRKETFLAKAGGQNVVTPTPITREETFLQAIIDNGGGGGGGGGVLIVNTTVGDSTITMDKTYAEIKSAFMNGLVICIQSAYGGHSMALVTFVYDDEEECDVDVFDAKNNDTFEFTCSSVNDYPTTTIG